MQSGATSLWGHEGGGGPKKWTELYIKGITLIPYCFPTEEHRKANVEKLEAAIKLWMTALGGGPSPGTNHKIIFSEYVDFSQNPRYCIDVNSPAESKWNMAVPYKTVAIWKDDGVGKAAAASTVGMGDTPGKPWDLNMWIDVEASVITLTDYRTALARARESDPSTTTDALCNDVTIADRYNFSGRSYTDTVLYGKSEGGWTLNPDSPYDADSIMHYHSYIMGNENCLNGNQAECPVARYRDSTNHDLGYEMIPMWTRPSSWDVAWVKTQYGWRYSGAAEGAQDGGEISEARLKELIEEGRERYVRSQV
ncbi:uncharacterized protein J4E84_004268 [Alternaria hordeiaustralica]|uniref:uncharacterized protein n=1 Tax=Alternaria hordeiaustralica TaxID=1187925 RepID=UPI0020C2AC00|nr:uncharacterized protein J4E84_004268 [Alternaria hordeiaustralica]KAI4690087.1 hypothetical protein J4E84_004268 [Alternaria hordeiaustralica]